MSKKKDPTPTTELSQDMIENIKSYESKITTIDDYTTAIRQTIGYHLGSKDTKGHLAMIKEIIQNSYDEAVRPMSPCNFIKVTYDERNLSTTVEDNGRGIPFDSLMRVYTSAYTSSNYAKESGDYTSGINGSGSKITLALSNEFKVESYVLGKAKMLYAIEGHVVNDEITDIPNPGKQGTIVSFIPSIVMGDIQTNCQDVYNLFFGLFPLAPIGTTVEFIGIDGSGHIVCDEQRTNNDGIIADLIVKTGSPLIAPVCFGSDNGTMKAEIAFTYDTENIGPEEVSSFSNFCITVGGTHKDGFLDGLCNFFRNYTNNIQYAGKSKNAIVNNDIKTGLKAVINAAHLTPLFNAQAKEVLTNKDMYFFVKDITMKALDNWTKTNPNDVQRLCKFFKDIADARAKSDEVKVKLSTKYQTSALSGKPKKYMAPSGNKRLELIIVEGNSALGSAKNSRCSDRQGLFPIRGKIPNAFSTEKSKFLSNNEIASLITLVGGGYGKSFDIDRVPWEKVITMCFTGDTCVRMLDGTLATFEQLYNFEQQHPGSVYPVYSYNTFNNTYVPGEAYYPRISGYVNNLVKVTLDDGTQLKCTPEHLFLTRDRGYIPAAFLGAGESLVPLYTEICENRNNYYGKEMIVYPNGKKVPTFHMVYEFYNDETEFGNCVHHIDSDPINDNPYNLVAMDNRDHLAYHNTISNKAGETVKQMHKNGVYEHTYFGNNGYNESDAHRERVSQLHKEGKYDAIHFGNNGYNESEQNRQTTVALNQDENMKILQMQGRISRVGATLVKDGYQLTPQLLTTGYQALKAKGYKLFTYDAIMKTFGTFDNFVTASINMSNNMSAFECEKYKTRDIQALSEASKLSKRTMIAKVVRYMMDNNMDYSESNYNIARKVVSPKGPTFDKILGQYFDNLDDVMNSAKVYNHKVVSVEPIYLMDPIPVYDLSVRDYNNFVVTNPVNKSSGVVVHNCDADPDGSHINSLLLRFFLLYMPEMITSGKLYKSVPPLFGVKIKGSMKYFTNKIEFTRYVQSIFARNNVLTSMKNDKLTNNEAIELFIRNIDYSYEMEIVSNTYAIVPQLLEDILMRYHPEKGNYDFKQFKKAIESLYRFVKVEVIDGVVVIRGLVDRKYHTVFLNDKLLNSCSKVIKIINSNELTMYKVNGETTSLYQLMKMFEASTPSNVTRYKGLGEQNPHQLAESALHPDYDRTLIRYTIEDIKQEIETIRYLESNKTELLKDLKITRQDIE